MSDDAQTLDEFERAVLARSLRAGVIWCGFGVLGVLGGTVGAVLLILGGVGRHPMIVLIMAGWFVISVTAAKSGWSSISKARQGLRDPSAIPSVADDLDQAIDP